MQDWKNLPLQVRQSESFSIFKNHLFADVSPWPDYFNAGSRVGQVLHTRLCLECSALNNDLYRRNLVASPLCERGEVENATHYIFQCPRFSQHRQQLLSDLVTNCTLRNLLFGSNNITDQENEDVLKKSTNVYLRNKKIS